MDVWHLTPLRSLDETDEETVSSDKIEELWLQEIQRREKECDDDPSVLVPYEDVMQRPHEKNSITSAESLYSRLRSIYKVIFSQRQ